LPKKVAARLARLDLEALPEEKRKRVEEYLEALQALLGGEDHEEVALDR
jgi:ParB family chromosome partitioning protein